MEIPDALKNLTVDDKPKLAFIATILHDEPCGVIVKRIAFFDKVLLKDVLHAYLRNAGAAASYTETDVARMSFFWKINALAGINLSPEAASMRDVAVAKLTPMRKIRNVLAHEAALTSQLAENLWTEADCRTLLANFPDNFSAESDADVESPYQTPLEQDPILSDWTSTNRRPFVKINRSQPPDRASLLGCEYRVE